MTILNEGGNIFKDAEGQMLTQRIDRADVVPTLRWLEKITNLPHEDFMLGSTGRKETSGDLDVAVNQQDVTKDELVQKLAAWCEQNGKDPKAWIRKTGISVHFLTPIRGDESKGFVQTDLMFGDPEWMKWSMAGSNDATAFSGAERQILMSSIATAQGFKWSPQQGLIDRMSNQVITRNPQEIAQHLIGPNGQADDLESVESILTKLRTRVDYQELTADARASFEKRGQTLPEGKDITRLRQLAGVKPVNENPIKAGIKGVSALSDIFKRTKPADEFNADEFINKLPKTGNARAKLEGLINNINSIEDLAKVEKAFLDIITKKKVNSTAEAKYLIDVLRAKKAELMKKASEPTSAVGLTGRDIDPSAPFGSPRNPM